MEQPSSQQASAEIRAHLARHGLRQRDLVIVTGLSLASVNRKLTGKSDWTVDEIHAVARFLGVSVLSLIEPGCAA